MKFTRDGRLVLSDSMMKTYQDCGARFWFTYLENPEELPRIPAFEFGTALHSMFESFYKRENPDAQMYTSAKNFANVFRGKWFAIDSQPKTERGKRKPPLLWRSADEKEKLLGVGYNSCVNFYERNVGTPFSHILVEQYFIVNLSNERTAKGYALQGYIDRLQLSESSQPASHDPADLGKAVHASRDGRITIVDYKSGYKHIPQHALNLDTQFSCYDLAADVLFPYMDRSFAVEEVRDGARIETTRGEGERRVLRERIFTIGAAIEKEKFTLASNMYKCGSCSYLKHCNSLQKVAYEKGIHPEDLMRASSPLVRGHRKSRSLFEWQDGEITRITDEKRLAQNTNRRHKPMQLSFFMSQTDIEENAEPLNFGDDIVETPSVGLDEIEAVAS